MLPSITNVVFRTFYYQSSIELGITLQESLSGISQFTFITWRSGRTDDGVKETADS